MEFHAYLRFTARISRWSRRLYARGLECRRHILPLSQADVAEQETVMRIAVIITTYNSPYALAAVLEGYLAQTDHDFEVLVADDGSTQDTAKVVQQFQARAYFPIHHVWQE